MDTTFITGPQVQMWVRIVLYSISGALVQHGIGTTSFWEPIIGVILFCVNMAWTIYGNRLKARIDEIVANDPQARVITSNQTVADASGPQVTSTADTKVVIKTLSERNPP